MEAKKAAKGSAVSVRLPDYPEGQCPKGHREGWVSSVAEYWPSTLEGLG